jgi:hypothetical protein
VSQIDALTQESGKRLLFNTIYLADYEPMDVRLWAQKIRSHLGAGPVREVPEPLLRAGAQLGDLLNALGVRFPITSYRLNNMLTQAIYDLSPLRGVQPELPFGLDEAIKITCEWLSKEGL